MAEDKTIPFPSRTARFRQVVDRCGRPEVHLLLVAPGRDRALQDLARKGRVMTIRQAHRGQGTDYGVVGIFPEPSVQFFVFARSLRPFVGKRIVGIDYALVRDEGQARPQPAVPRPVTLASPPVEKHRPRRPPAAPPTPAPAQPPDAAEIRRELRAIERLLKNRRYEQARDRVSQLLERMDF